MSKSKSLRLAALLAAVAVIGAAVMVASPASAAKGGTHSGGQHGGGTPTPPPSTATVTLISANPVPLNTQTTFRITGYAPGQLVFTSMSGYIAGDSVYVDSTGSLTYTFPYSLYAAGGYTFTTKLLDLSNPASVSFIVQ